MSIRAASPLGQYPTLPAGGDRRAPWACRESGPPEPPKPRLLDRVRQALRARHLSSRTEEAYVAWIHLGRPVSAGRHLPRQDSQGCEARGPAGRGADKDVSGDQSQNREGTRPDDPAGTAAARRSVDRMIACRPTHACLAGRMSVAFEGASNMAPERSARSHSLAAAAHCRRYAHLVKWNVEGLRGRRDATVRVMDHNGGGERASGTWFQDSSHRSE